VDLLQQGAGGGGGAGASADGEKKRGRRKWRPRCGRVPVQWMLTRMVSSDDARNLGGWRRGSDRRWIIHWTGLQVLCRLLS
jgi:hypothetical protein